MVDTCVCCGAYVPEGRQVCSDCEREANREFVRTDKPFDYNAMIRSYYKEHPGEFIKALIGIKPKRSFITRFLSKIIKVPRARSRHFRWLYE